MAKQLGRTRTHDAAPPRRGPRDQEAEPGELLCTIRQDGSSGDWSAEDWNPLQVNSTANGLEIRHAAADRRPAADERRIAAQLAPGHGVAAPDQRTPSALRALQGLLDRHYARRS